MPQEPGKQYFYVELTAGPAIVLMDKERPLRSSAAAARLEAGNYFHTLEAAQKFADLINETLKDCHTASLNREDVRVVS